jgi:hypothetical protein
MKKYPQSVELKNKIMNELKIELGYRLLVLSFNPNQDSRYKLTIGSLLEHENTEEIFLYRENIKELRDSLNKILNGQNKKLPSKKDIDKIIKEIFDTRENKKDLNVLYYCRTLGWNTFDKGICTDPKCSMCRMYEKSMKEFKL